MCHLMLNHYISKYILVHMYPNSNLKVDWQFRAHSEASQNALIFMSKKM